MPLFKRYHLKLGADPTRSMCTEHREAPRDVKADGRRMLRRKDGIGDVIEMQSNGWGEWAGVADTPRNLKDVSSHRSRTDSTSARRRSDPEWHGQTRVSCRKHRERF